VAPSATRHPALQAATMTAHSENASRRHCQLRRLVAFIFIFLGMIVVWMVVNTVLLQHVIGRRPFDPILYRAELVLSGLAGIQAPIIMMSQNRAAARDEILARTTTTRLTGSTSYSRRIPR